MKKLLLIYALICSVQSFAQSFNVAGHRAMNQPGNMLAINSTCYYIERYGKDCCGDNIRVIGVNQTGQISSVLSIPNIPQNLFNNYPLKLIKTLDNQLLVLGYAKQNLCGNDVQMSGVENRVVKIDTNGTVQFELLLPVPANSPGALNLSNEHISDIAQYNDGTFFAVSDSIIYRCTASGNTMGAQFHLHKHIRSIAVLANNNLLFSTENNGINHLIEASITGSIINQSTINSVITKFIESPSGNLYGLTAQGTIEKYSSSFSMVCFRAVPSATLTDFVLRGDSVFATGVSNSGGTNRPLFCVMNPILSIVHQVQGTNDNNLPTGIIVNNENTVNIVTKSSSTNTNVTYSNVYGFPLNGAFVAGSDVGVQNVTVNSTTFIPMALPYGGFGPFFPAVAKFDAQVIIKNYGADTITSFCLNHTSNYTFCSTFFKQYTITIPPGGTVSVTPGVLYSNRIASNLPSNTPVQLQECFFTTVPNASGDSSIGNDAACAQFTVNYVTGIASYVLNAADVELYPNPFTAAFAVKTSAIIKTVEVYNVVGALLHKETVNAGTATMDQSALPAGVYFVKLETERGTAIKKVVKQ